MAGGMTRMYGAATMVGKDERNGRINPALEPDDDLPVAEAQRQMQQSAGGGGSVAAQGGVVPGTGPAQGHTAF